MLAFVFLAVGGPSLFGILLAVFVVTLTATTIRARRLGTQTTSRGAVQVLANLLVPSSILVAQAWDSVIFVIAPQLVLASLAELTADTVSSEIGEAYGKRTLLVTSLKPVEAGTNGGISLMGTMTGVLAALGVVLLFASVFPVSLFYWRTLVAPVWPSAVGGIAGMVLDSILGATLERKGWISNEVVNLSGTASAAFIAYVLLRLF